MITTTENFDVFTTIVQLEQRIATLEKIVVTLNNTNEILPGFQSINQEQYNRFVQESADEVIAKYPNLGIVKKAEL